MISVADISLNFGEKKLFEDVSIKFSPGNCYGVIGANGAGKSTFLKILAQEISPSKGQVVLPKGVSVSTLQQDHFQYNEHKVLDTVLLGNEPLMAVMREKDAIYAKENFSDADGVRAAELEAEFANLRGWEAETDAATLLHGLGISEEHLHKLMKELKDGEKVKVLLAQALFGSPDVLLLDEPTNHLDIRSIRWLENYLLEYDKTVIVISHDRHFLNQICTHMVDIDYGKITVFVGNYDFWVQSITMARNLRSNENKKKEQKAKELEAFIRRFSANASKSRQATARRKQLDNLTLEDIPRSLRKAPHIVFTPKREAGDIILEVDSLSKTFQGESIFEDLSFSLRKNDKVLFIGENENAATVLFNILLGKDSADSGSFRWGVTTTQSYLPKEHDALFEGAEINLIDWLRTFSEDKSENFLRGFLGKMLFSGEDSKKFASKLSGGERVRCLLAKMMLSGSNVLLLDGPTNHLDIESITALNEGLLAFPGTVLFASHDQEFASSISSRLIELKPGGGLDYQVSYSEYLARL